MQLAAKQEFKLTKAVTSFYEKQALNQALDYYRMWEDSYRAFLRAMYENTQEYFAKKGIKEVVAYRGVLNPTMPVEFGSLSGEEMAATYASMGLQPMSSFATNGHIALRFARGIGGGSGDNSYMLAVKVPVERIVGTCRSGFGCLEEHELVVLGSQDDNVMAVGWLNNVWRHKMTVAKLREELVQLSQWGV
jgi:hypothetical protein